MINEKIEKILVNKNLTVKDALKQLDFAGVKSLFIVDENRKLNGSLTDGDIRRWILKEGSLHERISAVCNRSPKMLSRGSDFRSIREFIIQHKLEALPIVDENGVVMDVIFWGDVLAGNTGFGRADLNIPVLVMAGGKGMRLDPFTKILPKPLIPIGDKPIIELIMDQFAEYGCHEFHLTLNYKGKMIQSYFDDADCRYEIKFVWEKEFLGTAGSLRLAVPMIDSRHIFVTNCDILIKADYSDILTYHIDNDNDITVVGSMQHLSVPFGVLELKKGGGLDNIIEKPEYDFLANTGMYLIKRGVTEVVPMDKKFDFTELICAIKQMGGKVGVYPVSQQSWIDIGQWQEYHNALKKIEHAK